MRCFDLVVLIILLFLFLLLFWIQYLYRCYGVEFSFCSFGVLDKLFFLLLQLIFSSMDDTILAFSGG